MDEIKDTAKRTFVEREDELAAMNNDTLNQTRMLNPQQMAMRAEREKEAEKKLKEMLKDITTCLEQVGHVNPLNKVYKLAKELDYFPLAALLLSQNAIDQMNYDPLVFNLTRKTPNILVDGPHFIIGLQTIFKQFHFSQYKKFILYMIHFTKTTLSANKDA